MIVRTETSRRSARSEEGSCPWVCSSSMIDVLGDDAHAVTVYTVETPLAKDFRGMEYLTVEGGQVTHVISVFDRWPMIQARGNPQG
jgi:hypothetical protein